MKSYPLIRIDFSDLARTSYKHLEAERLAALAASGFLSETLRPYGNLGTGGNTHNTAEEGHLYLTTYTTRPLPDTAPEPEDLIVETFGKNSVTIVEKIEGRAPTGLGYILKLAVTGRPDIRPDDQHCFVALERPWVSRGRHLQ